MRVAVSARTRAQVEAVAQEIGGLAIEGDVAKQDGRRADGRARPSGSSGRSTCSSRTPASRCGRSAPGRSPAEDWWRVLEVNVLGVYLSLPGRDPGDARARRRTDRDHRQRRGVSSAASSQTAYGASKAAAVRFGETLANQLEGQDPGLPDQPGPRANRDDRRIGFPDDAPWTPPECAPRLVRALASGKFDRLSGRYLHAEHDQPEDARSSASTQILADDLNAIRLRR